MKRHGSSDSLGAFMSICPNSTDEHDNGNNPMYTREFQTMLEGLDEEGCIEESGQVSEKKRRLSVDQVKALEKNFEVENKLEPERKVKLAQELGLQPRQVAVWFQNRRARWKTKQLERDYGVLKANYDGLKLNYEKLQRDNEALLKEIQELRSKLNEDGKNESKLLVKEEAAMSDSEERSKIETPAELDFKTCDGNDNNGEEMEGSGALVFLDFKDGSSDDSDSSAILNEDNNNICCSPAAKFLGNNQKRSSAASMNISFKFSSESKATVTGGDAAAHNKFYQPQFVKIEEHNFLGEESCSTLFSDDQAPTLHWYISNEWN